MRYWRGNTGTAKEGYCGLFDDNATVPPDSTETDLATYTTWVEANTYPPPPEPLKTEIAALTAQDLTNVDKIKAILEGLRVGARML